MNSVFYILLQLRDIAFALKRDIIDTNFIFESGYNFLFSIIARKSVVRVCVVYTFVVC